MVHNKRTGRFLLITANVLIIVGMLLFVMFYLRTTAETAHNAQIARFKDMTKSLVQTTRNYLEGSQRIVDSWGNYINANEMTIEEAAAFVRECRGKRNDFGAQVLFVDEDELSGLSAEPDVIKRNDYTIKYGHESHNFLYRDEDYTVGGVNMTRTFTNQRDGQQSVGFYCRIKLKDHSNRENREAIVMYVIPLRSFEKNLKITNTTFSKMDYVVVTHSGDYISKNEKFKNNNIFEFLNSYNDYSAEELAALKRSAADEQGMFDAKNADGETVHYAHSALSNDKSFIIFSALNDNYISDDEIDYTLLIITATGLLMLFAVNLVYILNANMYLARARKAADQANRAKSVFLSTMSHDIRTPLNAILGFTNMAERHLDNKEAVRGDLEKISTAGDHLLMLVNDILELAKIENSQVRLEASEVSVDGLAESLKSIAEPIAAEKGIALEVKQENIISPYVFADRLRLNQICVNIISNALKYTERGGSVSVTLDEAPTSDDSEVMLEFVVADTGIGMSEDFIPHMFESFVREEDGRTSKVSGTGLGLAITKKLVDLMDGTIECESEEGRGSTFTVKLPLKRADLSESGSAQQSEAPVEISGLRVLVAEDNRLNREIVSAMLEMNGIEVSHAENGRLAVDMLNNSPNSFDLVLMDIRMPVMDGFEATRQIRSSDSERVSKIPIIALTADAFSENVQACLDAGMNAHVAKPIYEAELMKTIKRVIGGK